MSVWAFPVRDLLAGLGGSVLAVAAMVGVAALGLRLVGAGAVGPLLPMAAAVVALATGGSAEFDGAPALPALGGLGLPGSGGVSGLVELTGSVEVVPLGVTACGAVVLAAALLLPRVARSGSGVLAVRGLAVRAAAMVVGFPVAVAVLVGYGKGRITAGGGLVVEFRADPGTALPHAAGLVMVVIALCWLGSRRTPLPAVMARTVRPAVGAVVAVLAALALALTVTGLIAAPFVGARASGERASRERPSGGRVSGERLAGVVLLGGPNLVAVGLPAGVGVRFAVEKPDPLSGTGGGGLFGGRRSGLPGGGARGLPGGSARGLPGGGARGLPGRNGVPGLSDGSGVPGLSDLSRWLPGGGRYPKGLSPLDGLGRVLAMTATAFALLACGVLVAARTPEGDGGPVRRAVRCAARLGVAMAAAMPALVALAGISASIGVSILGFRLPGLVAGLHGGLLRAAALGLFSGAAGGLLGGLLWWPIARYGAVRRSSVRGWWRGAASRRGRRADGP